MVDRTVNLGSPKTQAHFDHMYAEPSCLAYSCSLQLICSPLWGWVKTMSGPWGFVG